MSSGNGVFLVVWCIISCGRHDKSPQAQWLKTIEIYSLAILEARGLKLVSLDQQQGVYKLYSFQKLEERVWTLPLSNFSGRSVPCLAAALLQASRSASSHLHLLLPHIVFSSVCINAPLPFSRRTFGMIFRAHPDNPGKSPHLKILNNICKDALYK